MDYKSEQKIKQNTEETPLELEAIKKLGTENLVLLKPIGKGREGFYLNYCRVHGYLDLFCTLKSMLNVCILALEDQQDLTLRIGNKESELKRVLEFARSLIPLEEGIYLDEMQKLMLPDEKTSKKTYEK